MKRTIQMSPSTTRLKNWPPAGTNTAQAVPATRRQVREAQARRAWDQRVDDAPEL